MEEQEPTEPTAINEETRAMEEVINAFFYYGRYGAEKMVSMVEQMRKIPNDHQLLLGGQFKEHIRNMKEKVEHNSQILRMIANSCAGMFGEDHLRAMRIHQTRRPSSDFMSKVFSTMRQICREWSSEGQPEREATFKPIIDQLTELYPPETHPRHNVRILVPGCGLGRLAYDLMEQGFTVQGNEFAFFMLFTSFFIINNCKQENQFTIYPFVFDKNNSWNYSDQLRPVTFPDKAPVSKKDPNHRRASFSICAGDFLEVVKDTTFDVIVTAWFIDTAHNVLEYIDAIYSTLEPGGVWINVGPLTWHFSDTPDEASIELPYSVIMEMIRKKGFQVVEERVIDSKYTVNRRAMQFNQFACAYFYARKPEKTDE
ncbi:carnosine N-methyltransferase [Caenorhabditis elegans]|uniref:carnosine N-methyltransferase n=1 Tax=Caenorhabditis elegans TaxID=6239 RepID=O62483_CAEEL|nr:Carnosine N-methyltransferase [Caenorhabditis elegans]CAB07703.1 Carnosine N-methyltransferase [Caenorhabditis elegans]|eukprot:NP_496829.1 Uncharacterized protein CELE_Y48E1C.2 [Caenorhabditis elegans]